MRHVRMLALCLVAAFAVGALAASSASASLPEWGKCVKLPAVIKGVEKKAGKGKYKDSNCSEKLATASGEFEFLKGTSELPSTAFTNTMTTPEAVLEISVGLQIRCTGETATGNLSGTKEVSDVVVRFKGCASNIGGFICENEFVFNNETGKYEYIEGEIFTRRLKGKLGYISGKGTATPKVGLELTPEEPKGLFAWFGCGTGAPNTTPILFSGVGENTTGPNGGDAIISPISPVNAMGTETTQVYEEKKIENPETHELEVDKGVQEPTALENGKPAFLETQLFNGVEATAWFQSGQEETAVTKLASGEELEIKA